MVNIRRMINQSKAKFRQFRTGRTQSKIMKQTAKLEAEKIRLGEVAKLRAAEQRARRDVEAIKDYNTKVEGPSKLQRFGTNLANVIEKGKEKEAKRKMGVAGRRRIIGTSPQQVSRGSMLDLGGKRGLDFGGNDKGKSPFMFGKK